MRGVWELLDHVLAGTALGLLLVGLYAWSKT